MSYQNIYTNVCEYINSNETISNTLHVVSSTILDGVSICAEKGSVILSDISEKVKILNNNNKTKKKIRNLFGETFPYEKIDIMNTGDKIYIVFPKNMEVRTTCINSTRLWTVKLNGIPGIFTIPQHHGINDFVQQENIYFLDITDYILNPHTIDQQSNNTINKTELSKPDNNDGNNNNIDDVLEMSDDDG